MKEQTKNLPSNVAEIIEAHGFKGEDLDVFIKGYNEDLTYLRESKSDWTTLDELKEHDRKNRIYIIGLRTRDELGGK